MQKTPPVSTFGERFSFLLDHLRSLGHRGTDKTLGHTRLGLPSSRVAEYKSRTTVPPADAVLTAARGALVDPGWLAFGHESEAPRPGGFDVWLVNARAAAPATLGPSVIREPSPAVFDESRRAPTSRPSAKVPKKRPGTA